MAFTISIVTAADIPEMMSIYLSAFSTNPLYNVLWPDLQAASQAYEAYLHEQ